MLLETNVSDQGFLSVDEITEMSGCEAAVIMSEIITGRLSAGYLGSDGDWSIKFKDYRAWLHKLPPDFTVWGI